MTWPQAGDLGWRVASDEPVRFDGERWHSLPPVERERLQAERLAAQQREIAEMHAVAGPIEAGWTPGRRP